MSAGQQGADGLRWGWVWLEFAGMGHLRGLVILSLPQGTFFCSAALLHTLVVLSDRLSGLGLWTGAGGSKETGVVENGDRAAWLFLCLAYVLLSSTSGLKGSIVPDYSDPV
jgi:hypothetical protein